MQFVSTRPAMTVVLRTFHSTLQSASPPRLSHARIPIARVAAYRPLTLFSFRRSGCLCLVTLALFEVNE